MNPPLIIDPNPNPPPPPPRQLPFMESVQDAVAISEKEQDGFYLSAFLFQCWLAKLCLDAAAQLAEQPDPARRSFQTGEAWRGFLHFFGRATDAEFPKLYRHLLRFAEYDGPFAHNLLEASFPLSIEHQLTGDYVGSHTPPELVLRPKDAIALMRRSVARHCDWLDSLTQFQEFTHWHLAPNLFDPDPAKRELASLGFNQRHFDHLDTTGQLRWLSHMSDAVIDHKNSPKWQSYRHASHTDDPERPWPTRALDQTVIKLWPLLRRYNWSCADLLNVLRDVLPDPNHPACDNPKGFALYCSNTLSLRASMQKNAPGPKPPGHNVALRIFQDLSGPPISNLQSPIS